MEPTTDTRASETGRRDRQREETRRRLFEAALTVFRRDGVGPARIEDIADMAGVSRGSFYFHFPTKDDVLAELLRESGERVAVQIDTVPVDAPLEDVLAAVSGALAKEWEADVKIFPDIATVSLRLAATMPRSENQRSIRARLAQRFAAARERSELVDNIPPAVLTDVFLINQCTAAIAWSGRPRIPLEAALKGMSTLFLHGAHRGNS